MWEYAEVLRPLVQLIHLSLTPVCVCVCGYYILEYCIEITELLLVFRLGGTTGMLNAPSNELFIRCREINHLFTFSWLLCVVDFHTQKFDVTVFQSKRRYLSRYMGTNWVQCCHGFTKRVCFCTSGFRKWNYRSTELIFYPTALVNPGLWLVRRWCGLIYHNSSFDSREVPNRRFILIWLFRFYSNKLNVV